MERRNFDSRRGGYSGHRQGDYGSHREQGGYRDQGGHRDHYGGQRENRDNRGDRRGHGGGGGYQGHNQDRERNDHRYGGGQRGHQGGQQRFDRDRSDRQNDRGPREAAAKEMLRQLFTFDDFASFSDMMIQYNDCRETDVPPLSFGSPQIENSDQQTSSVWYNEDGYAYDENGWIYDENGNAVRKENWQQEAELQQQLWTSEWELQLTLANSYLEADLVFVCKPTFFAINYIISPLLD